MLSHALALISIAALACPAQETRSDRVALRADLEPALGFEGPVSGTMPSGWGGGPSGTIFADNSIVHGGHGSVRIERDSNSPNNFSTVTKSIPIDFGGTSIELRGYLRTELVSDFVGLWMREDGDNPALAFNNICRPRSSKERPIGLPTQFMYRSWPKPPNFSLGSWSPEPERPGPTTFNYWSMAGRSGNFPRSNTSKPFSIAITSSIMARASL
jgi:hypothetical protein